MFCPFCGHTDTKVIDSRLTEDGGAIRRRRECEKCGERFSTYEEMVLLNIMVVKRDDRKEAYEREKGEIVMKELKTLDEVAYIRFASVYKSFKDVKSFERELKKL